MPDVRDPTTSTKSARLVGLLLGLFLVVMALLILATSEASSGLLTMGVALVVGGLGLDLIVSTLRNRRSLLSYVGPLP